LQRLLEKKGNKSLIRANVVIFRQKGKKIWLESSFWVMLLKDVLQIP